MSNFIYAIPSTYHSEPSDFQNQLYDYCKQYYECELVDALSFYKDLFPPSTIESYKQVKKSDRVDGHIGNPILLVEQSKTIHKASEVPAWAKDVRFIEGVDDPLKVQRRKKRILFNDYKMLDECLHYEDVHTIFCSGLTYIGKRRNLAHAVSMHALIFDIDLVSPKGIYNFLHGCSNNVYPTPNYIVFSGGGMHLYYVFEEPIPLYHGSYGRRVKSQLNELKHQLTRLLWNPLTIDNYEKGKSPQYQGINQAFRIVGSYTKALGVNHNKYPVIACKLKNVKKYDTLQSFYDFVDIPKEEQYKEYSLKGLEYWKEHNPDWYNRRIIKKDRSIKYWSMDKQLYNWWLEKIKNEATYGHRYNCLLCLVIYAVKCGIDLQKLEDDMYSLLPHFKEIKPDDPITEDDIHEALFAYSKELNTFPTKTIAYLSGIDIKKDAPRRNGRKQKLHLAGARALQEINNPNWREGNGRKPLESVVREWQQEHPNGTKAQCIKETGLSKPTVYKWWR